MRSVATFLAEPFRQGLRRDEAEQRRGLYLERCIGFRPTEQGCIVAPEPNERYTGVDDDFPFPQYFRGTEDDWAIDTISLYRIRDGAAQRVVQGLQNNRYTSFLDTLNGGIFVSPAGFFDYPVRQGWTPGQLVAAGVYHGGRLVLGGFPSGYDWGALQSTFEKATELGPHWILWGSVGQTDFPYYLFEQPEEFLRDFMEGEAGWMPVSWSGPIMAMRTLGPSIIVYGTRGVVRLTPATVGDGNLHTFAQEILLPVGVAASYAVGGNDREHYFVSTDRAVYRVNMEGVERLGRWPVLPNNVKVCYSEHLAGPIFVSPTTSMVFDGRLWELRDVFGEIFDDDMGVSALAVRERREPTLVSEPIDFGARGIKTVTMVEVGGLVPEGTRLRLHFSYDGHIWAQSARIPLSPEGFCAFMVSAVEFKVEVIVPTDEPATIEYLRVEWQATDNRFTRTQHVIEAAS